MKAMIAIAAVLAFAVSGCDRPINLRLEGQDKLLAAARADRNFKRPSGPRLPTTCGA